MLELFLTLLLGMKNKSAKRKKQIAKETVKLK
jgi:hypothetical protein